jgi:REP element-mobilizing transposase RayT
VPTRIRDELRRTVSGVSTSPRDESPGYHHVVTRGNNKRDIYVDERDREFFCLTVRRIATKHGWTVLAYCLMRNHYHLVISVGDRGLAAGMCELNSGYARSFNERHGRVNHLFGKRYWNRRMKTHASTLNAIRYVVQNPRAAGGSKPLEAYRWSSYAATIGLALAEIELAKDELLAFFGATPERALDEFRTFCSARGFHGHGRWQPP